MTQKIPVAAILDYCRKTTDMDGKIEYLTPDKRIYAGKNHRGYVFGAQKQKWTITLAQKWHAEALAGKRRVPSGRNKKTYFIGDCDRWRDREVEDCSGLIVNAARTVIPDFGDRTADTIFGQCTKTGLISTIPEVPGICLHKSGHIGVYLGNGWVYECRGTDWGSVVSRIETQKWTGWGYMSFVDYSASKVVTAPVEIPAGLKYAVGRYGASELYNTRTYDDKKAPQMRNAYVRTLQQDLNKLGSKLATDSVFGEDTEKAVIAFQKSYWPKKEDYWDGRVGPLTKKALVTRLNKVVSV